MDLALGLEGRRWRVDLSRPLDLSIPLHFDGAQPHCFAADAARATTFAAGRFVGDVRQGGSCNCLSHTLTPHCNGTHTECVGHLTGERISVRDMALDSLLPARLLTIGPVPAGDAITRTALQQAGGAALAPCRAVVLRTLPNGPDKLSRDYDSGPPPPYLAADAMQWLVEAGIEHLLVDLPSVDPLADAGLPAHRTFWGMPAGATAFAAATRPHATLTELIYVPPDIPDGCYLLNLQVAPFAADAAPSRPVLYPVTIE